ncbi:DUF1232 domain-containing protein [Solwaraspora sp. WMMD1047]|uniref:YkvA family protein n=1 Tax=Solwaraspora sp. WMMD1047 TaxID=3016102 RepID=UPI002416DADA|nr:DUF1232 domain-containing protein [Solwaraspora sp. WMMD1047]MDG4828255.1 DUF1232 domain-containing protein [Solwaraspora sp. WMMD1047]
MDAVCKIAGGAAAGLLLVWLALIAALLAYPAVPIDLIPEVIPVIGYADDAIIVALALRSVARRAGGAGVASALARQPGRTRRDPGSGRHPRLTVIR